MSRFLHVDRARAFSLAILAGIMGHAWLGSPAAGVCITAAISAILCGIWSEDQ